MRTIKAKIYLAQDASEEVRRQLVAATAHLDAGDLRAGDAHLALADAAVGQARLLIRGGRKRAALLDRGLSGDDRPPDDPTHTDNDWDWSANEEDARLGV